MFEIRSVTKNFINVITFIMEMAVTSTDYNPESLEIRVARLCADLTRKDYIAAKQKLTTDNELTEALSPSSQFEYPKAHLPSSFVRNVVCKESVSTLPDFIDLFPELANRLDWDELSNNTSITTGCLLKYPEKRWNLFTLSANAAVPVEFIKSYSDQFNWNYDGLSYNVNITPGLITQLVLLSNDKYKPFSEGGGEIIKSCPHCGVWDYTGLTLNLSVNLAFIGANPGLPWDYRELSSLPKLTTEFLKTHPEKDDLWDWSEVYCNSSISLEYLVSLPFWQFYTASLSSNISLTPEFLESNLGLPNWDWYYLSFNKSIPLSFIDVKLISGDVRYKWNWDGISNRTDLTLEFILKYAGKLDWKFVSYNMNFSTVLHQFVESNLSLPWDFKSLSCNAVVATPQFILKHFEPRVECKNGRVIVGGDGKIPYAKWNWKDLSRISPLSFIHEYPEFDWDFREVSLNTSLTIPFILLHLNKDWNWALFSMNKLSRDTSKSEKRLKSVLVKCRLKRKKEVWSAFSGGGLLIGDLVGIVCGYIGSE